MSWHFRYCCRPKLLTPRGRPADAIARSLSAGFPARAPPVPRARGVHPDLRLAVVVSRDSRLRREPVIPQAPLRRKEASNQYTLRAHPSVVAFSETLKPKVRRGKPTKTLAIRVYVERKLARSHVPKGRLLPAKIRGTALDVVEMGILEQIRMRPLLGGISVHNTNGGLTGTLGYFVRDRKPPAPPAAAAALGALIPSKPYWYALSCAHVLNNAAGPETIQPSQQDGGQAPQDWVGAESLYTYDGVDAAIAKIDVGAVAQIVGLPTPRGTGKAKEGMTVAKSGRTTGVTYGKVIDDDLELKGKWKGFRGCIYVENEHRDFVENGDSGSLLVDPLSELAIGLICIGERLPGKFKRGIANPIAAVLRAFPLQMLVQPGETYP